MELLDQAYLTDLCARAIDGNSNAFAELYAATFRQQYRYILRTVQDAREAADMLREVYTAALNGLPSLHNPALFTVWISRISFRLCYESAHTAGEDRHPEQEMVRVFRREFTVGEILRLPPAESQVILMKAYQGMTEAEIREILNMSGRLVRHSLRAGRRHLETGPV